MHNTMKKWVRLMLVLTLNLTIVAYPLPGISYVAPQSFALSKLDTKGQDAKLTAPPRFDQSEVSEIMWAMEGSAYMAADDYPRSDYRFDHLLDALDYEPAAAFEFVRDKIRFDPYRGVLRNAEGALGGRAGNAYDRSLLLVKLLEDMGIEARLAFGELDEENAGKLLQRALGPGNETLNMKSLSNFSGFVPEIQQRMLDRATRDYKWVTRGLGKVSGDARATVVGTGAVKSHVWVQAKTGNTWQDMDSAFPDAEIGDSFAKVSRYATEVEPDQQHVVQIAVIAETVEENGLLERKVLEHEITAEDAMDSRLYVTFVPRNPTMGGVLAEKLGPEREMMPVLLVDGKAVSGKRIPGIAGDMSASKSFFYGSSRDKLSGLYVDVRVGPKADLGQSARGILLDRVPPEQRRSKAVNTDDLRPMSFADERPVELNGIHQVLVSNGGSNPRDVIENVGLAYYFIGKYMAAEGAEEDLPFESMLWPTAMFRNAQLAYNENLLISALNDKSDARFFISEPRVYIMSQTVRPQGDDFNVAMSVDLLHDPIAVVADSGADSDDIFQRRVWHGVLQSSFETTLIEMPAMLDSGGFENLLSASTQSSGKSLLIATADDRRIPEGAAVTLRQDLAAGKRILLSESSLSDNASTWWSVARDGTTKAMLAPGLGGASHYLWVNDYMRAQGKGSSQMFQKPYYLDIDRYDHAAERRWADNYMKTVKKAEKATGKEARRRMKGKTPKTTQKRKGGGTEYGIVLEISLFNVIGITGILALTICALAIGAALMMVGYVVHAETRRRAGEPWHP